MDDTDSRVLTAITLIILFVFWGVVIYLAIQSQTPGGTQVLANCPTEQCATNIFNGEKRCPPPSGTIVADLGLEVCNPPELCRDRHTPYAIQTDGSTNLQGICQAGIQCRCVKVPSCANYVTSIFQTVNGNPYVSTTGQRTTFEQSIGTNAGPPIQYESPSTSFCFIPAEWLPRSSPGCSFIETVNAQSITQCMGLPKACNGALSNPCLRGTLAFITADSDNFDASRINFTPLGCVAGDPCPCGEVAIWNTQLGAIVCKSIL